MRMITRRFRDIGSSTGGRGGGEGKAQELRVDTLRERFAAPNKGPAPLTPDDLAAGILGGELFLEYQPKLDWRAGRITGVEGLVRWKHPAHGLVPPDRFVTLATDTALARRLTDWVIARAAAQLRQWRADGLDLEVSVNVAEPDLEDSDLPDRVERHCRDAGLDPAFLTLELPEPAATCRPAQITDIVTRLHLQGVRLAIEDFGRCYAPLIQLQRVPFVEVRADLAFVQQMMSDDDCRAIVEALIDVARELGLKSVAEGVEDDDILRTLIEMGCDRVQGNYISPPIADDRLPGFVHELESHTEHDKSFNETEIAPATGGGGGTAAFEDPDPLALPEVRPLCAAIGFSR